MRSPRPRRVIVLAVLAVIVGAVVLGALNTAGRYSGLTVPARSPDDLAAMLRPHMTRVLPAGEGPFPTALLFSGCDGVRDNPGRWAEALAAAGWASIIVDSHAARGFDTLQKWRLICAGQVFHGSERAGDVATALAVARTWHGVDAGRLALVGASHGGWAVMEFLSAADRDAVSPGLTRWPGDAAPLDGVQAAVLFYPYCGELNRAARRGWTTDLPVLFLLAEDDTITDETDCLAVADRAARDGLPVRAHVYPNVTHGFDQREKAPFSTLGHDAAAAEDAISRMVDVVAGPAASR